MKKISLFCLMLLSLNVLAQSDNDRPARDSFTLTMPVGKGTFYESAIPSSAFVVGPKILQLFPGETVLLEVEEKNGLITAIKTVKENKHPDRTLEISFAQNVEGQSHLNMVLKIKNPFKRDLLYDATIRLMKSAKWVNTSIIPVKGGLLGIETWPDVIISIALNEWKFI